MKLALCVFKYFPYGGLQRNFLAIAQELVRRGHNVTVYTGEWEGERPDGVNIELIVTAGWTNYGRNKSYYLQLKKILNLREANQDGVDLVVGFNKMPGLDVYYCADTCFATKAYENKGWFYRMTPRSRWSLAYEKAVFDKSYATQVLLLSANEGVAFQKYYATPQQRLHLMPPGISKNRVRNAESTQLGNTTREALNVADNEKLVAFLGSDYKRKGLDRLLKAVASLPDEQRLRTKVLVIGRDKRMREYQRLANQLGLATSVIFAGQRDDVPALLFASDYLAHPAYLENTGNVILEAVVAGLPVLCTSICGYAFYIRDHQLGRVVPEPFDQSVMNDMLEDLLAGSDRERERCIEFAKTADVFSRPQRIAETIEQIGTKQCR
jgi:UDP-glucose:(heptosyl)LPS alpha-1,3-glucosyltransferase